MCENNHVRIYGIVKAQERWRVKINVAVPRGFVLCFSPREPLVVSAYSANQPHSRAVPR
jgi:hypothetical protein